MIPDPDPIQNEVRRRRKARPLPPDAACALCGETDPAALRKTTVRRSTLQLLQAHHPLGEANDQEVEVVLCRNCHAKATAAQQDAGALPAGRAPTCLERFVLAMRSLAAFFRQLADSFQRWADQVADVVRSLDEHLPSWRGLPGIK
jgi:hypothetical protein